MNFSRNFVDSYVDHWMWQFWNILDVDGTGLLNVDVPAGGLLVQSVHLLQLLVGERLVDLGLDGGGGLLELLVHAAAVVRSLCWAVRGLECGSRISCHQSPASPLIQSTTSHTDTSDPPLPSYFAMHSQYCHPGIQATTISITKSKIWFLIHLWEGSERYSSQTHEFN